MNPSRALSLFTYKVGIPSDELTQALKAKIAEAIALGYDVCTDFVNNPYKEDSEVEKETGKRVFHCCGIFGIDAGVMNLMRRGKDLDGHQRYLPLPEPLEGEEKKKNWCDDDYGLEATDYILQPLSFAPSIMQRQYLRGKNQDPDELVELFYEDSVILTPSVRYLSWVLSATTDDVDFLRSIIEPLVTSKKIRMNGETHVGPVYVPNKTGCNIFFSKNTNDSARVMTIFSKVWRDNVLVINKDGEDVRKSVCVRFYSVPCTSEKSMNNELRRTLYPPVIQPETTEVEGREEAKEEVVVPKMTWRKTPEKPEVRKEEVPSGYRGRFAALNLD